MSAIGVALVTIGASFGIGWIASSAVNSIARQPESAPRIQMSLLIAGAMIEGVALFSAVVCLLAK
ncbi:MAG: ATP synthase F0 subunit C [Lentisphaerae bacterium RIFOXYC12_FULL_60_16]|nr:MAG: ATP synthase F0 subunit C [Lentisphaerae bacterium RIFOXYC12_FULL_60_16]OGV73703.1 MAG: ATP synthase F0 subunit C [Lentisphaerae bacterium RIFOXYA12_FULL_60_10]OGV75064.1 MAG: ATP synthase F0 subunit C [Lentisphaerae bacterium RIFOXYB12_FULL_60_10]